MQGEYFFQLETLPDIELSEFTGRRVESLFEEPYKMRSIGKSTLCTYLINALVGGQ